MTENMMMEADDNMTSQTQFRRSTDYRENNDNQSGGRISWDMIYKISQIAIYPILGAIFYMLTQMSMLNVRMAVMESNLKQPNIEVIQKLAVLEERLNYNVSRRDQMEKEFALIYQDSRSKK